MATHNTPKDDRRQDETLYRDMMPDGATVWNIVAAPDGKSAGPKDDSHPIRATFSQVEKYAVLTAPVILGVPPESLPEDLRHQAWTPGHPLDIPPAAIADGYQELYPRGFMGRAEALAETAEHNAEQLQDRHGNNEWAFVVELGDPIDVPPVGRTDLANGIGAVRFPQYVAIRITRPTPEEIARHAGEPEPQVA